MSHGNCVAAARPESTFERYEPRTPVQQEARLQLQHLADGLVAHEAAILASEHPFPKAKGIFLWGSPGTGKTHLVEAVINRVDRRAPRLVRANKLYLARYDFTLEHIGSTSTYERAPIVIIDDLWSGYPSLDRLSPHTDLRCFASFIASVYDRRTLVLITSNFPILGGILPLLKKRAMGRAESRLQELLAGSGEIHLDGPDYRAILAERAGPGDAFTIATVAKGRA